MTSGYATWHRPSITRGPTIEGMRDLYVKGSIELDEYETWVDRILRGTAMDHADPLDAPFFNITGLFPDARSH